MSYQNKCHLIQREPTKREHQIKHTDQEYCQINVPPYKGDTHVKEKRKVKTKEKKDFEDSEIPPTSINEKETHWSQLLCVLPYQVRQLREGCHENPISGFHTTSAEAKKQTHPPTRPKQRVYKFTSLSLTFSQVV